MLRLAFILCSLFSWICEISEAPVSLASVTAVNQPGTIEQPTTMIPWAFPWAESGMSDLGYCPMVDGWGWNGSLLWPVEGYTEVRPFGRKPGGWHSGIDLVVPAGTPVVAPVSGTVVWRGYTSAGYGQMVSVASSGYVVILAHLSAVIDGLECGYGVTAGDVVGYVGRTGNVAGADHLHLELRRDGLAYDPLPYFIE